VETGTPGIAGFKPLSRASIMANTHLPWASHRLVVGTAELNPDEATAAVEARIDAISESAL
jgi:hypothetical protein